MNVNELRDRILEISHNEVAPDTNLKAKAISWLNSAYQEMVSDSMPYLEKVLEKSSDVIITSGQGTLPNDVARIVKMVDGTSNVTLKQITQSDAAELDVENNLSGTAKYYWIEGDNVFTYPQSNTTLKLVYLREVSDLADGGLEADIVIPKQFHHALVWGGLVWSSIFERGFSSQGDLKLFQVKWDEGKRELKLSLASQPMKTLRVQAYDGG